MSSDLLYYYKVGDASCIGTLYIDKLHWSEGWSRYLSDTKKIGWEWTQAKAYSGNPIGARCLIQW